MSVFLTMQCFPILNDAIFCTMFFKKTQNIAQTMHIRGCSHITSRGGRCLFLTMQFCFLLFNNAIFNDVLKTTKHCSNNAY